jgi:type IV secretory pathway VirB2 component (pilin)
MKKLLPYILILIAVVGIFGSTLKVKAADPMGDCSVEKVDGSGYEIIKTTQTDCTQRGGAWTANGKIYNILGNLPCDSNKDGPGCVGGQLTTFDPAGENALGTYLNIMLKIFIGICAVLAVIMIVVGGLEYMTSELLESKAEGKERIKGAIFGLVLALGAYTLLYTINPALLDTDLASLKNQEVEGVSIDEEPQTPDPITKKYPNGVTDGIDWDDSVGTIVSMPSGVTVNKGECTKVGQQNCTSTRGLILTYIQTIKNNCLNCTLLVVNAGTEFWLHGGKNGFTSHGPNSPTVDLRLPDNALTNYIKSGTLNPKNPNRWTKDGISFLFEGDHWHAGP